MFHEMLLKLFSWNSLKEKLHGVSVPLEILQPFSEAATGRVP